MNLKYACICLLIGIGGLSSQRLTATEGIRPEQARDWAYSRGKRKRKADSSPVTMKLVTDDALCQVIEGQSGIRSALESLGRQLRALQDMLAEQRAAVGKKVSACLSACVVGERGRWKKIVRLERERSAVQCSYK